MNPVTFAILNIALLILIYKGGVYVEAGEMTKGEVVALYNYMSQILVELIKLANLILTITKSIASGNRVQELIELKSSMSDGSVDTFDKTDEHVVFDNVTLYLLSSHHC